MGTKSKKTVFVSFQTELGQNKGWNNKNNMFINWKFQEKSVQCGYNKFVNMKSINHILCYYGDFVLYLCLKALSKYQGLIFYKF